ncbi:MAG: response regulator [Anaerolineales bacterium]|nr:response regulator [Anaerolineales bacterium]MDW8277596.1 response regulator [Anaerolineales bacterium]
MSPVNSEKILIVESDPDVSDLIGRQALQPLGYRVEIAIDGPSAIKQAIQFQPDVILANLNLPGLGAKDLLVALSSQGMAVPVIVLAEKGQEPHVIQTFRLGAFDYLMLPVREAEVVAAVERSLSQTREARERAKLDAQLKQANAELQRRVRELTTIFSVGRAVISITDQRALFEKIVEAVTQVAEADIAWLTLKDEKTKTFLLSAHRGLPEAWARKLGQPLDDGISALVAMSAETLEIHGAPLTKFKVASLGKAAMVVPIKVKNEAIGLMTVVRKSERPFAAGEQTILEAIADYASISLINASLFRALSQTAELAKAGEQRKTDELARMRQELQSTIQVIGYPLELLVSGKMGSLNDQQKQAIETVHAGVRHLALILNEQKTQPR